MSEMTLEQVRDWHREKSRNIREGISTGSFLEHNRLADAIDAHLAKAVAPVAYRWMKDGEAYSSWLPGTPDGEILALSDQSGRTIEYAYGDKPAQPVEAVDDALPVPFSIDRTHKNQAFVTMGFDSVEHCTQFIKKLSSSRYRVVALAHPHPTGSSATVITDAMVDRLLSAMFENYIAYQHALMNPHTAKPFWKRAIKSMLAAAPVLGNGSPEC